ncbi:hypothetical protein PsorP6_012566 [Peronosclerospora sorghi]|uniref:Uncharacterized protein n=1 Tax=Peronosclerospora sorghi TaxID=230839 RepID=A0ACC0WIR6_9STRA|nr:hypothetical protein PsorP6_012566 [Peronosclerospora sorghi]
MGSVLSRHKKSLRCDPTTLNECFGREAQSERSVGSALADGTPGNTPSDETKLESLAGPTTVIQSMAFLQEQQHVIQEKEQELRELLNELVRVHTTFEKVRKHMERNFVSNDESLLELARVLDDDAQRIPDNLELVQRHLVGTNATNETLAAVTDAINEANTLLERHALSRVQQQLQWGEHFGSDSFSVT